MKPRAFHLKTRRRRADPAGNLTGVKSRDDLRAAAAWIAARQE
jgi:hypothetical protein